MDTKTFSPVGMNLSDDGCSLKEQSHAWIVHLNSGEATVDDLLALWQWRLQSPAHELAWIETARLWRLIGMALRQYAARHPRRMPVSHVKTCGTSRSHRRFMH